MFSFLVVLVVVTTMMTFLVLLAVLLAMLLTAVFVVLVVITISIGVRISQIRNFLAVAEGGHLEEGGVDSAGLEVPELSQLKEGRLKSVL